MGRRSNIERAALRGDWAEAEKLARAALKKAHRLGPRAEEVLRRSEDIEEFVERPAVDEEEDALPTDQEERALRPRDGDPPPKALTPKQQRKAELDAAAEATRQRVRRWQAEKREAAAEREAAEREADAGRAKYESFKNREFQQWRWRQPPAWRLRDFASRIAAKEFRQQVIGVDRWYVDNDGGERSNWARATCEAPIGGDRSVRPIRVTYPPQPGQKAAPWPAAQVHIQCS